MTTRARNISQPAARLNKNIRNTVSINSELQGLVNNVQYKVDELRFNKLHEDKVKNDLLEPITKPLSEIAAKLTVPKVPKVTTEKLIDFSFPKITSTPIPTPNLRKEVLNREFLKNIGSAVSQNLNMSSDENTDVETPEFKAALDNIENQLIDEIAPTQSIEPIPAIDEESDNEPDSSTNIKDDKDEIQTTTSSTFGLVKTISKNDPNNIVYSLHKSPLHAFIFINPENNTINLNGEEFPYTKALWDLIGANRITKPLIEALTPADKNNYFELIDTYYDLNNLPAAWKKTKKYKLFIEPYLKQRGQRREGLRMNDKKYLNSLQLKTLIPKKRPVYVYWNESSELIDRLRKLWASKSAGNTSAEENNEILSILEELRG